MNQRTKWIGIGIVGILALVALFSVAGCYPSDRVTSDPDPSPPTVTHTPRPTEATATSAAPATPDPREATYGEFFLSLAENIQAGFTRFSQQNELLSAKPSLLLDEAWVVETTIATEIIEGEAQRTIEYAEAEIPTRFEETHRLLVEAMILYRDAMHMYREGVEAQNVDSMTVNTLAEVQALMDEANGLVNAATAAMPRNED